MTDVERLLRDTLTDPRRSVEPDPQQYERVAVLTRSYRRRRARRWAGGALVAAAVVAVLVGVGGTVGGGPRPHPGATGTSTATGTRQPLTIGDGHAVDLVAGQEIVPIPSNGTPPGLLFALENSPPKVLRIDPATLRVEASADILLDPGGMALDPSGGRLWVWSRGATNRTMVCEYRTDDLTPLGAFTVPSYAFSGTATAGQLWLATENGLYRLGDTSPGPVPVATGGTGQVFSVAADPDRDRILVGVADPKKFTGVRVIAVDERGTVLRTGGALPIGKESIAVVDGRIWVGGYGSGGTPRLVRLDPATLGPVGTSPVGHEVGPGAILWAGRSVLWVRNGGDEGLSCVDPATGAVLQRWPAVQGPVASVPGVALGIGDLDGSSGTGTSRLDLNSRCAG